MSTDSLKRGRGAARELPDRLRVYARHPVDAGRSLIAGAVSDEDGMRQRAFVALKGGDESHAVAWARNLDGLEEAYESRATHCIVANASLYVLLQSDTQAPQTLSQTLLAVARLGLLGDVKAVLPLEIPGTQGRACSALVPLVSGAFVWDAGHLRIGGEHFLLSDPARREPFELLVAPDFEGDP